MQSSGVGTRNEQQEIGDNFPLPLLTLLFEDERLVVGGPLGLYELTLSPARQIDGSLLQPVAGWPTGQAVFQLYSYNGVRFAAGQSAYNEAPTLWQQIGVSWQPLSPLPAPAQNGTALLSLLATSETLLVGTDGAGLFASRDGGQNWQWIEPIGETFVAKLWAAPWDEELLLARMRNGLFRTSDSGQTWQHVFLPTDARVDAITAYTDRAILLGLGDGSLLYSNDNGLTWQPWGAPLRRDGLFYALQAAPDSSVTLLAGTQNGLSRSVDSGLSWQSVHLHNTPPSFYPVMALAQGTDQSLYLGSSDGVYRTASDKIRWEAYNTALPPKRVLDLARIPTSDAIEADVLFAATDVGLYRRHMDEAHWRFMGWEGSVPGILPHPTQGNQLYLRAAFERVYRTNDALSDTPADIQWEQRGMGMALTNEILSLAIDPTDPAIVFAGGATELFRSSDGSASWQRIYSTLDGQSIFALLVDAIVPERIYAGATNGLYRSEDSGETWQPWGDSLHNITISALAQHPSDSNIFFVGTKQNSLWYSLDAGETWVKAAELPAASHVYDILVDQTDAHVYAATSHGFWQAQLLILP